MPGVGESLHAMPNSERRSAKPSSSPIAIRMEPMVMGGCSRPRGRARDSCCREAVRRVMAELSLSGRHK